MKKVIFSFIAFLAISFGTSAQIIQSTASKITVIKEQKPPTQSWWTIKLGGGYSINIDEDNSLTYNVSVGYSKYFKNSPFYWNVAGGSSLVRPLWFDCYTAFLGPSIGVKTLVAQNSSVMFDAHLGCYAEFAFDDYIDNIIAAAPELGVGLWFNRFLVEIDFRPCIIEDTCNYRLLLNLGWRF